MPTVYRISQAGGDAVPDVDSVEAIEGVIRAGKPGRYHVDEITSDPLPTGYTSRRRGTANKRPDGECPLDPEPSPGR